MSETLGPATDNSGDQGAKAPARVAISSSDVPRRTLSIALGVATIVLTVVGVFAVLMLAVPQTQNIEAASPTTPPPTVRDCWDGSRLSSDEACPVLQGERGMTQWLVTPSVPFDRCQKWTENPAPGEIEVYDCLWEGQGVDVFISRWDSVTSAQAYFRDNGRSRQGDFVSGGPRGAITWVNDEASFPFQARVYLDPGQPYSINVVGQSAQDRDAALNRLKFRDPAELAGQGADR